ncbi:ricin-type beta-trefoil lectin domain protein [Streptomyces sp. NPDC048479]|uniref:ricin-type beta-trefoil lectin domain protein n=1 Tax=Streptomyces sp. NPDC048479 TaxID=3154725 RepID=UPI003426BFE0
MTVAAAVTILPLSYAEAVVVTGLTSDDNWILDTHDNRTLADGGSASGRVATEYCEKVGIGTAFGQCRLLGYTEEYRKDYKPNYRVRISDPVRKNCSTGVGPPASYAVTRSRTYQATNTTGWDINVTSTVNFDIKPEGIGVGGSVSIGVGINGSYSWGTSTTVTQADSIPVPGGHKGWIEDFSYYATAHVVAAVSIPEVDPSKAPAGMTPGRYWIVTDIRGDLPVPHAKDSASRNAQPSGVARVYKTFPMTRDELKATCGTSVGYPDAYDGPPEEEPPYVEPPIDGSSSVGQIRSALGPCLDVRLAGTEDGTPVQVHECNGTSAQRWTMVFNDNNKGLTIQALGKCLDVAGGRTGDHTPVQLWHCNESTAQTWQYTAATGVIMNPASGRCLDVPQGWNDFQLIIYECNNEDNQKWNAPGHITNDPTAGENNPQLPSDPDPSPAPPPPPPPTGDGVFTVGGSTTIVFVGTGACLDVPQSNTANGTGVQLYPCHGGKNQQWTPGPMSRIEALGKCLDIRDGSTSDGTEVVLNDCNASASQMWSYNDVQLINSQAIGKCLETPTGANGRPLIIRTCNRNVTNQKWQADRDAGFNRIR